MSKISKAVDALFAHPQSDNERRIKAMVDRFNERAHAARLFEQRKRLADAERTPQGRATAIKAAAECKRIVSARESP